MLDLWVELNRYDHGWTFCATSGGQENLDSKVTFLVPVYNGGEFLAACLDCIVAQTYPNWSAVVVDNASSDKTAEVIAAYCAQDSRFSCVTNAETLPVIENHNVAARHLPNDAIYCKVLHVDDWISPDYLTETVALADANPTVGIVGSWAEFGDEVMGQISPLSQRVFSGVETIRRSLLGEIEPFRSPSVLMIRCSCLESLDQFYELDGLHADIDATYSLLRACDFGSVAATLVRIGRHDDSMTAAQTAPLDKNRIYNLDLLRRHGPKVLSSDEFDGQLERMLDTHYRFLARSLLKDTPDGFWAFHRSELKALGQPLQTTRLFRECCRYYSAHPRAIARAIKRMLMRAAPNSINQGSSK